MNPTAVQEAIKIGFPMDRLLGVWWSGCDDDARPAGSEAKGYSALISSDPGHPQIRRRQGSEPGHIEGQSRREPLQPRRSQALKITDARWKEIGLPGFTAPVHLSCADHNGHGGISLVQWDGTKWSTTVNIRMGSVRRIKREAESAGVALVRFDVRDGNSIQTARQRTVACIGDALKCHGGGLLF